LAATEKAFSSSRLILANAAFNSSEGPGTFVSTPFMVLAPHFGQKRASSGSFSLQFEQYAISTPHIKQIKARNLNVIQVASPSLLKCKFGRAIYHNFDDDNKERDSIFCNSLFLVAFFLEKVLRAPKIQNLKRKDPRLSVNA